MPVHCIPPELRALLVRQDNVVALWQLSRGDSRVVGRNVASQYWSELSWQVFLAAPGKPSDSQRMWAALLHCGEDARLAGRSALQLHGWKGEAAPPFDVVVGHTVRPTKPPDWLRVRRTRGEITGPAAEPLRTSIHTATAQAAAWSVSDRQALFVVLSALQQRLTTAERMRQTLAALPKLPRRAVIRQAVEDFANGSQSINEFDFGRWCRRHGLPAPRQQRRLLDASGRPRAIDAEFQSASGKRFRVEVEGLHHLDPAQYFADITRHNDLAVVREGTSLRITTWHLGHEAEAFVQVLRTALAM